jgi:hypothetical protein
VGLQFLRTQLTEKKAPNKIFFSLFKRETADIEWMRNLSYHIGTLALSKTLKSNKTLWGLSAS